MRIVGRVQGVGFRYFVNETARRREISGWVQNRPDGGVEAEAQGEDQAVAAFIREIETKHPWARVEKILSEKIPERAGETGFEIRI